MKQLHRIRILKMAGASPAATGMHLPLTNYLLLFTIALLLSQITAAQPYSVNVTIIVPPPYSPYLQDYLQYENKMVVQLQNLTSQSQSVKLVGSVEGDNGSALVTNENYQPATPINIPPNGIYRIPGSTRSRGFLDPNNLEYVGPENLKIKILKDGILPEGTYTICIRAVDYTTGEPLSDEAPAGCTIVPLSFPTPPQTVLPECESDIESRLPAFQWTLPGGNTGQAALQYDLYIVEWLEGANPQDLVQLAVDYNAGNAIVRRNLQVPLYQYLATDPKLKENTPYLWVVKVRDRMGRVTFENEGLSEICSFTYRHRAEEPFIAHSTPFDHHDLQIQQVRTQVKGKLNYKFPGDGIGQVGQLMNRNLSIPTEGVPFNVGQNAGNQLEILNDDVYALAAQNYIDAFPVSTVGSKPLANMTVRLVEGWVIRDCNVTYYPNGGPTVHKDYMILPDEYRTPFAFGGGTTIAVYIDGITNMQDGNSLYLDTLEGMQYSYSRTLKVDHTDNSGRFQFNFTQSTPGLLYNNYPGYALIYKKCEPVEVPVEGHDFVHPLDEVANPGDIYNMQPDLGDEQGQLPVNLGMPGNMVNRLGYPGNNPAHQGYDSIVITGGHLVKVLRLEVASPFFYSPNLIFWTQPGDTMELPDQVSYVKSIDLDLLVEGGMYENRRDFQFYDAGLPVPHIDVVASRKVAGLPAAIPMEEGQGLRDNEGAQQNNNDHNNGYELHANQIGEYGYQPGEIFDSVSVLRSNANGMLPYKRLVAGHPYYFYGSTPESGALHYDIPLQHRQYEVFIEPYCMMNLETNLNSFSNHQAIRIRDTIITYPQPPKVFGRVVTTTNADIAALRDARVRLFRYHQDDQLVAQTLVTETDQHGLFHFDPLPVNQQANIDYRWRLEVSKPGFETLIFPDTTYKTRPGVQWSTGDVVLNPLGNLLGYIKDEDGKAIPAIIRLADGPFVESEPGISPVGTNTSCGDDNSFGDALNESTKPYNIADLHSQLAMSNQASRFTLPAQSGSNLPLIIIPLPEQYFQETCHVNVQNVPYGQYQDLGNIIVKEKLHRLSFAIKDSDGNSAQAKVYVGDHMRKTNVLGFVAFRFASPAEEFHVRIVPDLPSLVPIDTVMEFPVSRTYQSYNFVLKEGRKLKILVVREQTGQYQSENPTPIAGVTVQTLLSSSDAGNAYIECITNADGVCTLEGVPTSSPTVDVSIWKEDDELLYIGKTVAVSTTRPLNPPFKISMKVLANVVVPDIWGFPTAITDLEIKAGNNGRMDTLLAGIITTMPGNIRFTTEDDVVQVPYPKIKFVSSGERDENGRRIMKPASTTGVTLHQHELRSVLYEKFDVTLSPKRSLNGATSTYLHLQRIDDHKGKIAGVVETELSSFNYSYTYNGKFYLGKTPTEYNIDVFQSGQPLYIHMNIPVAEIQGQEPEPGPNDFYLMDIGPNNKPRSQAFTVFQFPATSDSSRSFVSEEAFYIHTILHTDIDHVTPRDLKLSIGKIVVTNEALETMSNGLRMLDFKLGKNWRYYSTSPFQYNFEFGSITAATGIISTGQIDVPVEMIKIKPDQLYISQLHNIDHLTLAGIKDLQMHDEAKIIFGKGNMNIGWKLLVHRRDAFGNYDHDAVVATLNGLPEPFRPNDYINIKAIELNSESDDMHLNLDGNVRPYDICDFTVQSITTGNGYFILNGSSYLGREGVRVPNLASSFMGIQFNGPANNITGRIVSSYQGIFETKGSVSCTLDPNTASEKKQLWKDKKFYSTNRMRIYEEGKGEFFLNGILEVDYNYVKIHIIDADIDIPDLHYARDVDQAITFEEGSGKMLVRSGLQPVVHNKWEELVFEANMVDFEGISGNQPPMTFIVTGAVSASNTNLEVENIEIAGGLAEIELTYDFENQSLFGSLDFTPPVPIYMGPVSVNHILAQILAGRDGFIFGGKLEGKIAETFPARLGILLGSHSAISNDMISEVMSFTKFQSPPPDIADGSLSGFFITAQVHLVHAPMDTFDFEVGYIAGGAEVGFDARVYMDFDAQGFAFGFGALAYAEVLAAADSWLSPCGICLAASLQLMLTGEIREVGNRWDVAGTGCGSLLFTLAICGVEVDDIGGKCDIDFSTLEDRTDISAAFGESCSQNPAGGFDCPSEEE